MLLPSCLAAASTVHGSEVCNDQSFTPAGLDLLEFACKGSLASRLLLSRR